MDKKHNVDNGELYKLIINIIKCGMRGSSEEVVIEHITNYLKTTSYDTTEVIGYLHDVCECLVKRKYEKQNE